MRKNFREYLQPLQLHENVCVCVERDRKRDGAGRERDTRKRKTNHQPNNRTKNRGIYPLKESPRFQKINKHLFRVYFSSSVCRGFIPLRIS